MIPRKPHHKGFKSPSEYRGFKKTQKPLKQGKRLNPKGKSTRATTRDAWDKEMRATYAHIESCEYPQCHSDFGLSHAHSLKKTKITTREQYLDVVKLCTAHHHWIEYGGRDKRTGKYGKGSHQRMFNFVQTIKRVSKYR